MINKIQQLGAVLTSTEQKSISGGMLSIRICKVFCPSGCKCTGILYDECEFTNGGGFCHAL